MVSELELKVREMDDVKKSINQREIEIAEKLEIPINTVHAYLIAKRQEFDCYTSYQNYLARKKGLKSYQDLRQFYAINNRFLGKNDYHRYLRLRKKGKVKNKEDYFDGSWRHKWLHYIDSDTLDKIPSDNSVSERSSIENSTKKEHIKNLLGECLDKLNERSKRVIIKRFYEEETLGSIGKVLKISEERVRQLGEEALKKLYFLAKKSGLYDLYIEKGN